MMPEYGHLGEGIFEDLRNGVAPNLEPFLSHHGVQNQGQAEFHGGRLSRHQTMAALTDEMGGRNSAMICQVAPSSFEAKTWPLPVPK